MSEDAVAAAVRAGALGLAAELLEAGSTRLARRQRRALVQGRWQQLELPRGNPVGERLEEDGARIGWLEVPKGIYALATFDMPGGLEREARPRRVVVLDGGSEPGDGAWVGIRDGFAATRAWLYESLGRVDIAGRRHVRLQGLGHSVVDDVESVGSSAGLPAALALAYELLGEERAKARLVAATGDVRGARVVGVDGVAAKARAAVRELPGLERLYVPRDNEHEVDPLVRASVEVVGVTTVAEALEDFVGTPDDSWLPRLELFGAAKRVLELETEQRHAEAAALAGSILAETGGLAWQSDFEAARARVVALAIEGINLTHRGESHEALSRFEAIRDARARIDVGLWRDVVDNALEERIAAREASALLDCLEAQRALELIERHQPEAVQLSRRAKIELLGTKTRALAVLGRLDEALEANDAQLEVSLGSPERGWSSQRICNRIDVLFRYHARGQAGAMDRAAARLREGRVENARVTDQQAREANEAYLGLWESRLCGVRGDVERALDLAGDLSTSSGRYPSHYRHRFAGEAMLAAGRLQAGLDYLDETTAGISAACGRFERIVLLTAAAAAALARIDHALGGWDEPARAFLEPLNAWNPNYAELPDGSSDSSVWRESLTKALARFPY